jgi:hypothetical protein
MDMDMHTVQAGVDWANALGITNIIGFQAGWHGVSIHVDREPMCARGYVIERVRDTDIYGCGRMSQMRFAPAVGVEVFWFAPCFDVRDEQHRFDDVSL